MVGYGGRKSGGEGHRVVERTHWRRWRGEAVGIREECCRKLLLLYHCRVNKWRYRKLLLLSLLILIVLLVLLQLKY